MAEAPWMSRWQRSPRQDRRVVEDGVFVELGKVHLPEPPVEEVPEQEQSALELVTEAPKVPEREDDVDKTMHVLPIPPFPSEAWQFIEDAQKSSEVISGTEAEEGRYGIEANDDGSTPVVDDGARSESGVQGTAEPVEGNAGANGEAPEAEGTPATEGSESDERVPASNSVASESGQSLSETMQAELEPLPDGARRAADGGVVTHEEIVRAENVIEALTEEQSDALAETMRLPEFVEEEPYDQGGFLDDGKIE